MYHHFFHFRYYSQNSFGLWTFIGVAVPILFAWIIYRIGVRNERKNVIESLKAELNVHRQWFRTPWSKGKYREAHGGKYPIVFKLSTAAIDNAIIKGTTLFVEKSDLMGILVGYRQRLDNFNQYLDIANSMRANISNPLMAQNMENVLEVAHEQGIGDQNTNGMNSALTALDRAIKSESERSATKWFWLGGLIGEQKNVPKSESESSISVKK